MRSTAFVLAALAAVMASPALAQTAPPAYRTNCQSCHQAEAKGLAGQFPRLNGRASKIASSAEGRKYLTNVLLYGVSGKISVDGRNIMGVMPAYARLSDADLAAILTYLSRLDAAAKPPAPFTAAEVQAARAERQTSAQVAVGRAKLVQANLIP